MGLLQGKVALVSGAARGHGAAHAIRLAAEGADIIGVDIAPDAAATRGKVEALGRRFIAVVADVRDRARMATGVADAIERAGRVDIVVAAAEVRSIGKCWELPEQDWNTVVGTNLTGSWNLVCSALPTMIAQGDGGSIVLTGASAGFLGFAEQSHYAASKHALVGLTKSSALDLAQFGIRVNIVHPTAPGAGDTIMPVDVVSPEDASEAVLFFASDTSRMISGSAMTTGQRGA